MWVWFSAVWRPWVWFLTFVVGGWHPWILAACGGSVGPACCWRVGWVSGCRVLLFLVWGSSVVLVRVIPGGGVCGPDGGVGRCPACLGGVFGCCTLVFPGRDVVFMACGVRSGVLAGGAVAEYWFGHWVLVGGPCGLLLAWRCPAVRGWWGVCAVWVLPGCGTSCGPRLLWRTGLTMAPVATVPCGLLAVVGLVGRCVRKWAPLRWRGVWWCVALCGWLVAGCCWAVFRVVCGHGWRRGAVSALSGWRAVMVVALSLVGVVLVWLTFRGPGLPWRAWMCEGGGCCLGVCVFVGL